MRYFLLILVVTTNVLTSCGQTNSSKQEAKKEVKQDKPKGDRGKMNLRGNVQSFVETTSRIESTRAGDNEVNIKSTYVFNQAGNKVEFNSYTNGDLMEKNTYEYDTRGNKTKEIFAGITDFFKYNNIDSVIEWKRIRENKIEFTHLYTYDATGKIIKDESSDGLLTTYSYDKNGIKTVNNYFVWGKALDNRHDLQNRITLKYDANKNLIERTEFTPPKPSLNQEEQNIYQTYKYDNNGNLVEETQGNLKQTYKYDNYGNIIEEHASTANGESLYKYKYVYIYDNVGNWTKKTKFENGKESSVFIRKYTYF